MTGAMSVVIAIAVAAAAAAPQGTLRPGHLPSDAQIEAAIDASPTTQEARAALAAAEAEARGLAAGPHELSASLSLDKRRVRGEAEADGDFAEWAVLVGRGVRLPGKARLDRRAGEQGAQAALDGLEDARHQASLSFADLWISWLEAEARLGLDEEDLALAEREAAALARRVELKDAAVLDFELAQAQLANARMAVEQSRGLALAAHVELDGAFPGLAPARAPALDAPRAPLRPWDEWSALVLERSHEIAMARVLAEREATLGRRLRLDQRPDPNVGVRAFNERGGDETGVGLVVTLPFGGGLRSAAAERQAALASAAEARYAGVVRTVTSGAARDVVTARARLAEWTRAQEAALAAGAARDRVRRAYELGERDLSDLLVAQRQSTEARRSELQARAAAHRALLKLALDAHELWLAEEV